MTFSKIHKELKKKIKKGFDKRCQQFNINCPVCQAWLAMDLIEDIADSEKEFGE